MGHELVFRTPGASRDVTTWTAAPPVASATLEALAADLAHRLGTTVEAADYRYAFAADGIAFELDAYGGRCDVPSVDTVWELLDTVCERTGWVAYDPLAGRVVFGASRDWAERAFALLIRHGALEVRPDNRSAVLRVLRKIGGEFSEDPETAVAELVVFAELEPAIDELFGETSDLVALLRTLG